MIKILKEDKRLLLSYTEELTDNARWIDEKLASGSVTLRRTFTFQQKDLLPKSEYDFDDPLNQDARFFLLGLKDGKYFKIDKQILGLKYDLLFAEEMDLKLNTFIAERNISIFRKIDELINEPIVIGGQDNNAIPIDAFEELLKNFPTSTELRHYSRTRVAGVLMDYLGTMSDVQTKFDRYLERRRTIHPASRINFLKDYEPQKYEYVRDELREMLNQVDNYTEKDWQKLIVDFLLLIFPKYITVIEECPVKDFYSNPLKAKSRRIDMALVDANGAIDIIEIKKPVPKHLLSKNKYRDNYVPRIELSGTVMQVEKYIFHLNKWGREGEKAILKQKKAELPPNFEIRATNPRAMIILGRDYDFTDEEIFDFEIIKRKYANIIDIMTYDDLLRRLDNIITMINKNYSRIEKNTSRRSN